MAWMDQMAWMDVSNFSDFARSWLFCLVLAFLWSSKLHPLVVLLGETPAFSLSSFLVSTTTVAMGSICGAGDDDSAPHPARILAYNTAVFVCARVDLWSGGKKRCIGREKTRIKVVRIGGSLEFVASFGAQKKQSRPQTHH